MVNRKHLSTLYYSLVYTHLIYGITLWGAASKIHISPLDIMHKKIVRIIGGAKFNSHTAPILKKLGMLKLEDIYRVHTCKYIYKYIRGLLPLPLSNIFNLAQDTHSHLTRQSTSYKIQAFKARTRTGSQSIINMGPKLWNDISPTLYLYKENLLSISAFTRRLKSQIVAAYE